MMKRNRGTCIRMEFGNHKNSIELVGGKLLNCKKNCLVICVEDFDQLIFIILLKSQIIKFYPHHSLMTRTML